MKTKRCQGRTQSRRCRRKISSLSQKYCHSHQKSNKSNKSKKSKKSNNKTQKGGDPNCKPPATVTGRIPFSFVCKNKCCIKGKGKAPKCFDRKDIRFQIYYSWADLTKKARPNTKGFLENFQQQMLELGDVLFKGSRQGLRPIYTISAPKTGRIYPYLVKQNIQDIKSYAEDVASGHSRRKSQFAFFFVTESERQKQWGKIHDLLNKLVVVTYWPRIVFLIVFYNDKKSWNMAFPQRHWDINPGRVIEVPIYTGELDNLRVIFDVIYYQIIWNNQPDFTFKQFKTNAKP